MAVAGRDFERAVGGREEEVFQFFGLLGMAQAVAEEHHAISEVSRLPCVEEAVGRR